MPRPVITARTRALVAVEPPTPVDVEISHLSQLMALAELLAEADDRWDYEADPEVRETYLAEAEALLPVLLEVMSSPPAGP